MSENIIKYKTDCFAYTKMNRCRILRLLDCKDCSFYKSKEDYNKDLDRYGFRGVNIEDEKIK